MKTHKLISAVLAITLVTAFSSMASVTEVGISPDPYDKVWSKCTDDDIESLRQVCYWESSMADAPIEVTEAVIETVLNRCISGEWSDGTIKGVVEDRKYGRQFVYGAYTPDRNGQQEQIDEAIEYVRRNGRTILPSYDYIYFATKKQSCAKNHVLVGDRSVKHHYMYFGEDKNNDN